MSAHYFKMAAVVQRGPFEMTVRLNVASVNRCIVTVTINNLYC